MKEAEEVVANEGKGDEKEGKGAKGKKKVKNDLLLALQEELERKRAEEERVRLEQEELQRLAEEVQRQEEEKVRLEKERKEMKKQRRKEEIARQKAEGIYLTKTQKEQRAKMEQARKMFLASGNVIIPAHGGTTGQGNFLPPKKKSNKSKMQKSTENEDELKQDLIEEELNGEKKEGEMPDTWEDESEDDWEKIDEEDEKGMENGGDSKVSATNERMDQLTNKMKHVELANGDISSAGKPAAVEQDSSEEETSRYSKWTYPSLFAVLSVKHLSKNAPTLMTSTDCCFRLSHRWSLVQTARK